MATVIKAPNPYTTEKYTIFLAGSIDMGKARPWHEEVFEALAPFDITLLSPKREEWDASWDQCKDCEPFREQVLWEHKGMEDADCIIFCFTKESKAPVTMYELGRFANVKDALVCVEEGFYRQGNLDIYMEKDKIPTYHQLDGLLGDLKTVLTKKGM